VVPLPVHQSRVMCSWVAPPIRRMAVIRMRMVTAPSRTCP
jgi:hypothetical protein